MGGPRVPEVSRMLKRGLSHYGVGELEAAIVCWEKARALDPGNAAAADYLETAYEERAENDPDATPVSAPSLILEDVVAGEPQTPRSWGSREAGNLPLPSDDPETRIRVALDCYRSGDLEAAWSKLQEMASEMPDRLDVQGYLGLIDGERAKRYESELGDATRVLRMQSSMEELKQLSLRPEEGFLLSQIDGTLTIEELISVSTMDRFETLETLVRLVRQGVAG